MKGKIAVILLGLLFTEACYSRVGNYALYTQYSYYDDITQKSDTPKIKLVDDVSANLDLRLFRVIILTLSAGAATDMSRSYGGFGFKVDLPGFFLIDASINDLIRRQKRRGANTSLYFKSIYISNRDNDEAIVGTKLGFSADFFITQRYYFIFDVGLYSHGGNQFFNPALGLGYEF